MKHSCRSECFLQSETNNQQTTSKHFNEQYVKLSLLTDGDREDEHTADPTTVSSFMWFITINIDMVQFNSKSALKILFKGSVHQKIQSHTHTDVVSL